MKPSMYYAPLAIFLCYLGIAVMKPATAVAPASASALGITRISSDAEENALRDAIATAVTVAWNKADFAALDAMADEYARTRAKTLSGKWRLAVYDEAVTQQMRIDWPTDWFVLKPQPGCACGVPDPARYAEAELRWDAVGAKLDQWRKRAPKSAYVQVARANYLSKRAWFYRGAGYANTVPDAAWPYFNRYIAEAGSVLAAQGATGIRNPAWFDSMISVARDEDWPQPRLNQLAEKLFREGQAYTPAYQNMAYMLEPKWGGSYAAVEKFARTAIARAPAGEGAETYTRIYWVIQASGRSLLFQNSPTDWPMMRRGFEDMLKKYPNMRNLEAEAKFACLAGDRETVAEALGQMGGRIDSREWPVPIDSCKAAGS